MIKKIVAGTLLLGLAAFLIFGAVNRTIAKSGTPIAQGAENAPQLKQNSAENNGPLQSENKAGGRGRNAEASTADASEADCDNPNHEESKRTEAYGQGSGRSGGEGTGGRSGGQGNGGRNKNSAGSEETHGETTAQITVQGLITSANEESMTVSTDEGTVIIEGRAWRYVLEQGFAPIENEPVTLFGFYEDEEFKIAQLIRENSGEILQVREQGGRPMWAGNGNSGRY